MVSRGGATQAAGISCLRRFKFSLDNQYRTADGEIDGAEGVVFPTGTFGVTE